MAWSRRLPIAFAALAAGCTPLTAFNALVPKDRGVELIVKDAAYGPDERQKLDVYRPKAAGSDRLPIIVFIYGGSWDSGTKSGYAFVGRALAAKGFVVAIPDYRLVPQVRYPAFVADGATAVRWIIDHAGEAGGDPQKLILAGHSAGAYNAAMLAYDDRWLGRDRQRVRAFIGLAGPYDFLPLTDPVAKAAFEGTANLAATQPVALVQPGAPPAFLATGLDDRVVRPHNSDALAAALRRVGSPVVRRVYPDLGHAGILTSIAIPLRSRSPVLDEMTAFARRYAGSPAASIR